MYRVEQVACKLEALSSRTAMVDADDEAQAAGSVSDAFQRQSESGQSRALRPGDDGVKVAQIHIGCHLGQEVLEAPRLGKGLADETNFHDGSIARWDGIGPPGSRKIRYEMSYRPEIAGSIRGLPFGPARLLPAC
jgi:hypothetical protein